MPQETVTAQQEYYCRLTDAGAALEAAAHAEGKPVILTHVAVGDGAGEVPLPEASATALVHEVLRREIDGKRQDEEDKNITWLHVIIPADEGGFWIREFGVYAEPLEEGAGPVLYAVGNHAPYYKQQTGQGQATTHELSIPVIHSGTAEVEIAVKDAGYASQLALDDLRQSLLENDGAGPRLKGTVLPLATQDAPGIVQPDGATVTVDGEGLLRALGGNLLLNSEQLITESGTFTAPVGGWYKLVLYGGGASGAVSTKSVTGGSAGATKEALVRLEAGQEVPVVIGAGGVAPTLASPPVQSQMGGETSFGDITTADEAYLSGVHSPIPSSGTLTLLGEGAGPGSGYPNIGLSNKTQAQRNADCSALGHYGAGGAAVLFYPGGDYAAGAGAQGSVYARWHDPAKAAGPLPEPALLSARRMASRAAAAPATVNLYDPETGQGSVWRAEDAEAKLAGGLISEEAWLEIRAGKAAEEYAAWLASPDTEAGRFELLRDAREVRLAATDYLMAPDYPLTDDARARVTAYRQSLRDLPAQDGAPWDGGGELTPWPEMPEI